MGFASCRSRNSDTHHVSVTETDTKYAGPIVFSWESPTACLKWWNYWMLLLFHESCNGCGPWFWPLFSNEMIECPELSNSFCLAVIHTMAMPPSHAQLCTVHHNTLQWPQLPAFLTKAQGHLQFRIQVETSSFALCRQHEAKFGWHSTQGIPIFSRIFCETLYNNPFVTNINIKGNLKIVFLQLWKLSKRGVL